MADKRDILIRLLGEETVAKMADRAGDGLDRFGKSLDATETDAKELDRQIGEVEGHLRTLATAFARTGDAADRVDITKAIRRQQTELRKLTKAKDLLPDFDNDEAVKFGGRLASGIAAGLSRAGGPISAAMSNVFGTLPPQAQVAIGAGVVAAGAAAAPALGAVVSGAIVGAAGAGGIVGGIAIAARHPQVKASATLTGQVFSQTMQRAAVSFVPATLDALGTVRAGIGDMEDDLQRAFSATSRMVAPLTDDFMAGAKRAVEGFATAAERAGPVVDAIGEIGRRVGDMLADTFEGLSEHSSEGAHALLMLWGVFEYGIRSIAGTIEMLTATYGWLEKIGAFLTGDMATLGRLVAEQEAAKGSSADLSAGLQELLSGFDATSAAAATSTQKIQSWADAVRESIDRALASENANIRLEQAIDDAAEAAKNGAKKGIDPNTQAGRENRKALLGIAEAAKAASDDILTNTGSHELAAKATERGRKKFLEAADAMGVEKKKAVELADKLFGIPTARSTKFSQPGMESALNNASLLKRRIDSIDRRIDIRAKVTTSYAGSAHSGYGYSTGYSAGGYVDGPGPKGIDSKPAMLAPGEGVLTAAEVDAVGGAAGFERLRAMIRGGGGTPAVAAVMGGRPGGGSVVNHYSITVNVPATANPAEVGRVTVEAIKAYERGSGKGWRT